MAFRQHIVDLIVMGSYVLHIHVVRGIYLPWWTVSWSADIRYISRSRYFLGCSVDSSSAWMTCWVMGVHPTPRHLAL